MGQVSQLFTGVFTSTDSPVVFNTDIGFQFMSLLANAGGATIQGNKTITVNGNTNVASQAIPLPANVPLNLGGVNIQGGFTLVIPVDVSVTVLAV
jgi:hypothetical protein